MLQDGAQAARTGLALERLAGNGLERGRTDVQLDAFHREELLVLLDQRVLRLGEDADQRGLVQLVQRGQHGQTAHQFGDQAELDEVVGLDVLEEFRQAAVGRPLDLGAEADAGALGTVADHLVHAVEGATADEQDVGGVDLHEVLVGVLAPALRRDRGHGALDELQQRLLHALARDVPGDGRVVGLARDLVDLVDVDDARLGLVDLVVAGGQQLLDDALDVLADVAGLGERGGVGHHEGHVEQPRQRLGQQRLARTGGADQQDVALGQLHVVLVALVTQPLVVVVDRHGQRALGLLLANHVLVEDGRDLGRDGQLAGRRAGCLALHFVTNDLVAQVDALVADVDRRTRDELAGLVLALAAERAVEGLVGGSCVVGHALYLRSLTCCRRRLWQWPRCARSSPCR